MPKVQKKSKKLVKKKPIVKDENLYVITTYFNPKKYKSRYKLYKEFEKRTLDAGAYLIVVEATFKNEPPQIVSVSDKHIVIRVKAECTLWLKENLINIGILALYHLKPKWKYVAWIDGDLAFARPDWVEETKRLLGEHPIIQMFTHITHLNKNYQPMPGFAISFMEGWPQGLAFKTRKPLDGCSGVLRYGWCGAPGGAWAATRDAMNDIFPLIDIGILGSGDIHFATALMGHVDLTFSMLYTDAYRDYLLEYQDKVKHLGCKVGCMKGLVLHYWHGKLSDRGYDRRWKVLIKHDFNPYKDLIVNSSGLYSISPDKPDLIKDVEDYFSSRNEDSE